jgi:MFS family permease
MELDTTRSMSFFEAYDAALSQVIICLMAWGCIKMSEYSNEQTTNVPVARSNAAFVLLVVQAGWTFAGMDFYIYNFSLPLILLDLKISVPTAGVIFFLSLQGTFVGSLVVPLLADVFGRRRAMMGNILLYALTTGAVAFAASAAFLTVARFLVNFGAGGEQAVGATYIAEERNPRRRWALGFLQSGVAIGTLLASLLLATVGATFGWRPLFLIGVLPALLVVAIRLRLPESGKWSLFREQRRQTPRTQTGQARERFPLAQIFASDLRKFTLIGMVLLVAANFANGGILSWAPVFLHQERGLDIASIGWYGIVLAVGQLVGLNVCGWLADRIGRRATLGLFWSLGILSVVAFGLVTNLLLLAGTAFFVGFSLAGIFSGCLIYLSEVFPTPARATGMGWCLGIGLFSFSLAPLLLGVLAPESSFGVLFAVSASAACLIGLITLLFAPETKGRELM